MYKQVLIAIDGSEDSYRAAKRVKDMVKNPTKVVLFNAIEEHFYDKLMMIGVPGMPSGGPVVTPSQLTAARKAKAKEILEKAKKLFRATLIPVEMRVIEDEGPEEYMLNVIEEEGFDLVAIGCETEHSAFRRIFLGTIGSKLLYEAPCDVLIVR